MNELTCRFCGKLCKNKSGLSYHENRCHKTPNRIISYGNHGNMPKHINKVYDRLAVARDGTVLDITNRELEQYKETHKTCEICGKTIDEATKWKNSKYSPKNLCVDHDHNTNKFRGMLCSVCNRQLGWYENYRNEISKYLNKDNMVR